MTESIFVENNSSVSLGGNMDLLFLAEHWIFSHVPPSLGEKKHSMYYLIIGLLITILSCMSLIFFRLFYAHEEDVKSKPIIVLPDYCNSQGWDLPNLHFGNKRSAEIVALSAQSAKQIKRGVSRKQSWPIANNSIVLFTS